MRAKARGREEKKFYEMFNELRWGKHKERGKMCPIVSNRYFLGKGASLLTDHQAKGRA